MTHKDGRVREEAAVGDGPIDATFKALARATGCRQTILQNYEVHNVTFGQDAQGQVTVVCDHAGRQLRGQGVSTDIVEASALAFVNVINQVESLTISETPSSDPSSWPSNPPATSGTTAS
jgi:2-isopropylmalate synthase